MKTLRKLCSLLCLTALIFAMSTAAMAADGAKSYELTMTVNGGASASVQAGDTIHIEITLTQTSPAGGITMYAIDDDLCYNSRMFALVESSVQAGKVTVDSRAMDGSWEGWTQLHLGAWASAAEGESWDNPTVLLRADFTALQSGTGTFMQRDAKVYITSGMDNYQTSANSVSVIVGADGGGAPAPSAPSTPSLPSSPASPAQPETEKPGADPEPEAPASAGFKDVPAGAWYENAVNYAVSAGLFSGTGEDTFSPGDAMTRAMLVTVVWRMEGKPATVGENPFTDVKAGMWYTDAVVWAAENNIVSGYGDGLFGTDDGVTRQQLAAILFNYGEKKGYDMSASADIGGYNDGAETASWAAGPMKWAVGAGIITGTGDGGLAPAALADRAQVAELLMRFDKLYK